MTSTIHFFKILLLYGKRCSTHSENLECFFSNCLFGCGLGQAPKLQNPTFSLNLLRTSVNNLIVEVC